MGFNIAQQFTPGAPALGGRGAYGIAPMAGSSNLFGAAIPMAGKFASFIPQSQNSELLDIMRLQVDPTFQEALSQQKQKDVAMGLAAYKEMGDQQMKYNLINRGLTALQTGIERGITKYQDPYTIANLASGIGKAYAEGAEGSRGLTQLGAGIPAVKYYNV